MVADQHSDVDAAHGVDVKMLIRDHDNVKFEDRKAYARKVAEEMNKV
ncbi:MAG: hypothetical protein V8T46_11530 [Sutterella seckii]